MWIFVLQICYNCIFWVRCHKFYVLMITIFTFLINNHYYIFWGGGIHHKFVLSPSKTLGFILTCWFFHKIYRVVVSWRNLYHIETSPFSCRTNQWTGFYMIARRFLLDNRDLHHERCNWAGSKPQPNSDLSLYDIIFIYHELFNVWDTSISRPEAY